MPSVLITTREGWIGAPDAIFDEVQAALTGAIGAPPEATAFKLSELPAANLRPRAGMGERFVEVQVTMMAGRNAEQKQALFAALKQPFVARGTPEAEVKITLIEAGRENWG
jgi:phenylpyruvate tautomerase PptA (4-oxalocrotonate tautomerase family)